MADQKTPAEMRAVASRIRPPIGIDPEYDALTNRMADLSAGADALDALARVRSVYERYFALTVTGCSDEMEMLLADISEALEGETDDEA